MSRFPPQGYPPPFPHPQYYSNPDHPIPYRGPTTSDLRSPATLSHTSTHEEEGDKDAEDGGWGRDGPLIEQRKAKARKGRGHSRGMNSFDKTAIWLKTSQSGPSAPAAEKVS
jgi:hypothetical protein